MTTEPQPVLVAVDGTPLLAASAPAADPLDTSVVREHDETDDDGTHHVVTQANGVRVRMLVEPTPEYLQAQAAEQEASRLAAAPAQADINAAMAAALDAGDLKRAAAFLRVQTQGEYEELTKGA